MSKTGMITTELSGAIARDDTADKPSLWIMADVVPPLIRHKSGGYYQSKMYPVLIEGVKDPAMGFYWKPNEFGIWKVYGHPGRDEILYYYDLPAAPSDRETTG